MAGQPIAIFGITGRMGQALVRALRTDATLRLSGAIASVDSARLGQDAAAEDGPTGVLVTADAGLGIRGAAVAVDFSSSRSAADHARCCAQAGIPILIGTTGLDAPSRAVLEEAARKIPVLLAPNTSVGVGVVAELAARAALVLGASYDVEIFEAHHRLKRDAPSGTALALGEAIAAARGQRLDEAAVYERTGQSAARGPSAIGFSSVRAGDIVGEHTVIFAGDGERVEITHRATDRAIFARGALRAAGWLVGRPAGLYGMKDALGF